MALSAAGALALSACGGDGDDDDDDATPETSPSATTEGGATGEAADPTRQGPREIEGATEGGIVNFVSVTPLETMHPSEIYYTHTYSIGSGLMFRSLTQYVIEDGVPVLVPDLATDNGTPNEDFTEWTFTIRDGVRYENGQEVTAEDIAYGIKRSFDRDTFPEGLSTTSNDYFLDGDKYQGSLQDPVEDYDGVVVDGSDAHHQDGDAVPRHALLGRVPGHGPDPRGRGERPREVRAAPVGDRSVQVQRVHTGEVADAGPQRPEWDPATDPGRHAYPDGYDMEFDVPTAEDRRRSCSADQRRRADHAQSTPTS